MNLYGLLGEKLGHSLSPIIHKIVFESLESNNEYKLFEVEKDKLSYFIDKVRKDNIKGFNITIPYKEKCMKYLDEISYEAKRIGAVNTVINENGKLKGYNTDYFGFGYLLRKNNIVIEDKIAVILGNGGATKALAYYLLDNKIKKLYIVSRNPNNGHMINEKNIEYISYDKLECINGDILINSTPVGMYPNVDSSPVDKKIIENYDTIVDIIYNPEETVFMKYGKELGKKSIGGLLMLVGQGVKAEEIWQKCEIKSSISEKIYNELIKEFR